MRFIIWIIAIIYCFCPDFLPGPIDDALVTFAAFGITSLMNRGGRGGGNNPQIPQR